jgi:hypothetical protein
VLKVEYFLIDLTSVTGEVVADIPACSMKIAQLASPPTSPVTMDQCSSDVIPLDV